MGSYNLISPMISPIWMLCWGFVAPHHLHSNGFTFTLHCIQFEFMKSLHARPVLSLQPFWGNAFHNRSN